MKEASALRDQASLCDPLQWRRGPLSFQCLGLRPIKSHDNEERSPGRGQPVGLLVGTGGFVLEVEREPAVGIFLELRDHWRVTKVPIEGVFNHQLRGNGSTGHYHTRVT